MQRKVEKIPATVITGFLGAGKTTLIRHLLETAKGRRIALIINEFGDLGIDGEVLAACENPNCTDDDIIELANGCICCTVADDFIPTMTALLERDQPPEHIVIETSGLALPQPLVRAFNWPEVRARVTVDGVVTVIDGRALADGRFAEDEDALAAQREADEMLDHDSPLAELFEDQLKCADMILLNKTDLLENDSIREVEHALRAQLRPGVRVLPSEKGRVEPDIILGMAAASEDDIDNRRAHHEDEDEDHEHDDFESFIVPLTQIDDTQALLKRLEQTIADHDILRLKGFVAVGGKDLRLQIQAVGPRVDSYFDRAWEDGEARESSLVVIGLTGLNKQQISAALQG